MRWNHINVECLSRGVFGSLHSQLLYSGGSLASCRSIFLNGSSEGPSLLVDQILIELSLRNLALREGLVLRLCLDLL
jgi:hypothetical protein